MANPFAPDSRLNQLLAFIVTVLLSNLAAMLGLGLILTGGWALLMLFTINLSLIENNTASFRSVWTVIRQNWLIATLLWFVDILFFALVIWEFYALGSLKSGVFKLLWGALLCLAVFLVLSVNAWIWPMLVKRKIASAEILDCLRACLLLSFHYLGRTVVCIAVIAVPVLIMMIFPSLFWQVATWLICFGVSFGVYLIILLIHQPLGGYWTEHGATTRPLMS